MVTSAFKETTTLSFFNRVQRSLRMCASICRLLYLVKMFGLGEYCCWFPALSWTIMVVKECCSLIDLYNGIHDGSIEVPSTSSRPFEFPATLKEQPFAIGPLLAMFPGGDVRGSGFLWHLPEVYGRVA